MIPTLQRRASYQCFQAGDSVGGGSGRKRLFPLVSFVGRVSGALSVHKSQVPCDTKGFSQNRSCFGRD